MSRKGNGSTVKPKPKPQFPFESLNQQASKRKTSLVQFSGVGVRLAVGKAIETASPCRPITNSSSSFNSNGVTSPYLVKFPEATELVLNAWQRVALGSNFLIFYFFCVPYYCP